MSQEIAERQVRLKRRELENAGFNFGPAQSEIQGAGSGGFFQVFENAHLYWHANTGAHEVHGTILKKYLELGGPGVNQVTGRRDFGFPKTDELRTVFGVPMSRFEFGDIYAVPGTRAVGLYGDLQKQLTGTDRLPILEPQRRAEGEVLYCERSAIFKPKNATSGVIRGSLATPDLGCPAFVVSGDNQDLPISIGYTIDKDSWEDLQALTPNSLNQEENALKTLAALWKDRLVLQSVRNSSFILPLSVHVGEVHQSAMTRLIRLVCRVEEGASLPDRELFTLCFRRPDRNLVPLALHCLYSRKNWDEFGFIHATDFHVSRRFESFRGKLKSAGRTLGARAFVNPNDSVRAFFNYANKLHDKGQIDFILATGDLVDYVFEDGDDRNSGGNFAYFEKLLRGQAPSKDEEGAENQALHVPIFTVLGNHDYVENPYELLFKIDVPLENPTIAKYGDFNLIAPEARAIQGVDETKTVSRATALNMAVSSRSATEYYQKRINRRSAYVIELGNKHRIVMLDTGPNKDVIDSPGDALEEYFGRSNEDEDTFVRHTPNSEGGDLSTLRNEPAQQPAQGIFIIGMHNPPMNTFGNEYPHYFRETERPKLDAKRLESLVVSFLVREAGLTADKRHPSWLRIGARHFKKGSINDLLDFGIGKSGAFETEFLELCISKKVDAVLCGHVHQRVEFRVRRDETGERMYFTDFYTENPATYRESFDWSMKIGAGPVLANPVVVGDQRPIHIQVNTNAEVGEAVHEVRDHHSEDGVMVFRRLRVPPYADPLDQARNKTEWWSHHRPLILQTACLGPIDYSQRGATTEKRRTSFQGIRLLTVKGEAIARITYIGINDIRSGTLPTTDEGPVVVPPTHTDPSVPPPVLKKAP